MESNETTQAVVDPQALAERLAQLEAATPGVIDRLVKLAAREELRDYIEPIVDKVLEERAGTVDLDDIPFGQDAGKDEPPAGDQPMTTRQKREATMKDPFVERIAQWFRGLSKSEKLSAFMLQTCLSADQCSSADVPVGLNELANVIIREYSNEFEESACEVFEPRPGESMNGLAAVAFVIEQMQR